MTEEKPSLRDRLRSLGRSSRPEMGESKPGESKPDSEKPTESLGPKPDLPARIDGLRGWLDQIERRQGRMTYFGGAAALIALVAAGAALFLGVSANQDSASKKQLDEVKAQITRLNTQLQATNSSAQQVQTINQQLTALQQRVKAIETKQAQQAKEITTLKQRPAQATPAPTTTTGATGTKKP